MESIVSFLRSLGAGRLAAMGAVTLALVGFFAFLMLQLSQEDMDTLFTDLTIDDSAQIVSELEGRNVPFEIRSNGATILVPRAEVLRLRLAFAEEGVPAGGTVGYEIFDNQDTFGVTSFVQQVNRARALEGELSRTIRSIGRVEMARVHLVLPERELFARDMPEPSASIVLRLRGDLEPTQIRAIQHLTAAAVKDLKPGRVSIVDENGRLLASGNMDDEIGMVATAIEERRLSLERRLRGQIAEIVESVVGIGRARVQVTADLDHNRVTQTSDVFDPEGRVVRSTQTREENSAASETNPNDEVTVGNELPNADGGDANTSGAQENASSLEEIVNYEISKTSRTEIQEAGRIQRLSVAVLVDGIYTENADGTPVYAPRAQEQLDQIAALVRSAVGFDQQRGDTVEVVNLQFAPAAIPPALEEEQPFLLGLTRAEVFQLAELVALLVVAILVLLLVVRPLVKRIVSPEEYVEGQAALIGSDGVAIDPKTGQPALPAPEEEVQEEDPPNAALELIDVAQVNGQIQASTVERVGDLVKNNPEEAVTIVRQWMNEAA
ncbi:MAG: flagellar basal-body MS-ring/collar protein FliF [Pseudomonadota bacterium]